MNRELISKAIGNIDDRHIIECASYTPGKAGSTPGERTGKSYRTMRRVLVLAAVIALLLALGTAAYATDWFGLKPLALPVVSYTARDGQTEEIQPVSLSQPQAVPEELEEANELAEKNKQAWEEFLEAQQSCPCVIEYQYLNELIYESSNPKRFKTEFEDSGDGTLTVSYYVLPDDFDPWTFDWTANPDGPEYLFDHSKEISKADSDRFDEIFSDYNNYECEYDFHYNLHCDNEKAMLEEIAAKYGLNLRPMQKRLVWSSETTGQTGEDFFTNAELAEMTAQICAGNIFYETPAGFDKLYWYDEGTFGVSYFLDIGNSGRQLNCYGYNSVYTTLSTGSEVISTSIRDNESYSSRTHVCPDGTEVEIVYSDSIAYFYVYLDHSFFAGDVTVNTYAPGYDGNNTLTDAEIDLAVDSINYSLINK